MEFQDSMSMNENWLGEPFLSIDSANLNANTLLFPPSGSDTSGNHSPVFTDVSEENSENGGGLILIKKRKDSPSASTSSMDHREKKGKKSRAGSHDSEPHSNDGEEQARSGRKGHKKSRQGCFNCKKRKIKCQETRPACENCTKKDIECRYPPPRTLTALRVPKSYSPNPLASVNGHGTPTTFSMTDMRLFHHYMMEAYPHLPVGNDTTWLSQIPLIAHHNQYLMHAILGMSASHFELVTGEPISSSALHHRMLAIKGSNEAMSSPRRSGAEADALLAACYLLAFQSAYMRDGLYEFFRTVRGCSLVSDQLRADKLPMSFHMSNRVHFEYMEQRLLDLPTITKELIGGARDSLDAVAVVLNLPINISFHRGLSNVIDAASVSSTQVYFKWMRIYQLILVMSEQDFETFIPPSNTVGRILIAHFLAIQIVIGPILDREWQGRRRSTPIRTNLDWIYDICTILPPELMYLIEWPKTIAEAVDEELAGIVSPVPKVSVLRRREGLNPGVI